jgi:competence protein ComEA
MAAARMAVLDVPLDLDRAPAAELESLPGIGPELAARIVAARPFPTVEAVGDVAGIGPKRFSAIVPRLFLKGCENCIAHGAGR